MDANDDDRPPQPPAMVRVIGFVSDDGEVTITDLTWQPNPKPPASGGPDAGEPAIDAADGTKQRRSEP